MAFYSATSLFRPSSLSLALRNLSLTPKRSFSAAVPTQRHLNGLPKEVPPYPYPAKRIYKQADHGLYGGGVIQFGNKISKGRNKGKTRRTWKLNVRHETLRSEALGRDIPLRVTHRVLRTIEKVGGLDNYLLDDKPSRIKELGLFGWKLRCAVMQSGKIKQRFEVERKQLGLGAPETFDSFLERYLEEQKIKAYPELQQLEEEEVPEVQEEASGETSTEPTPAPQPHTSATQ
ncbi:hypothetical protein AJ80_00974 [Polytolypa hystricis UAMH7299]|uniref:Large ribosomal subunit protein bL28m n=1 Tax=Polytolypa hystricis (strain UAMH7299) TaxID=1447883 RepID=A0A2B7YT97_POLH7|nr:hypothetical protein AJ80_00974 [Polytolypa hystricis UAMH7299]